MKKREQFGIAGGLLYHDDGTPADDTLRCKVCGYAESDQVRWGDHHLCRGEIPKREIQPARGPKAKRRRL